MFSVVNLLCIARHYNLQFRMYDSVDKYDNVSFEIIWRDEQDRRYQHTSIIPGVELGGYHAEIFISERLLKAIHDFLISLHGIHPRSVPDWLIFAGQYLKRV